MWQECSHSKKGKIILGQREGKKNLSVINISWAGKNVAHFKMENKIGLKKTRIFHNFNSTSFARCGLF